jgi:hypothetical protein
MPGIRGRQVEVSLRRALGHLMNRRHAKGSRSRLFVVVLNQLDDAEQFIAESRQLRAQQSRKLFQASSPPNPMMRVQRHDGATAERAEKDGPTQPIRCIREAVQPEDA